MEDVQNTPVLAVDALLDYFVKRVSDGRNAIHSNNKIVESYETRRR